MTRHYTAISRVVVETRQHVQAYVNQNCFVVGTGQIQRVDFSLTDTGNHTDEGCGTNTISPNP